jgi:diketogulonate reductase-like aldo/keto reductase
MTRNSVLSAADADGESNAMEAGGGGGGGVPQQHRAPLSPQRGVVARRSSRLGDPNSSISQMVRISSRAAKRGMPLLPGTTKRNRYHHQNNHNKNYRFIVVLVGSMLTIMSVGFLILGKSHAQIDPATTKNSVELGPDGQIVRGVAQQHQQHQQRSNHHEEEHRHQRNAESKEEDDQPAAGAAAKGDDRQGEDDQQQVTEGGDDGTSADTTRRQRQEEEQPSKEAEQEDDETDEQPAMRLAILPAHRVLSLGLPYLLYGTAWKKDETTRLVQSAVTAGFRFIDTACQPKHYHEKGVGDGWTIAANELSLDRRDLFLQTKYTSVSGQDINNIPYDPTLSLPDQVAESLQVSLRNLRTTYLDSWVMHGLETTMDETMVVYRAMEQAVDQGRVLRLGVSNCYDLQKFQYIYDNARIKPEVLQNRFYGDSHWDIELRRFCQTHDIWYQSFWTLTANRDALQTREAVEWAARKGLTPQTLLYAYLMNLGYGTPLDGTTNYDHMVEDVAVMQRMQKEFQGGVDDGDKIFANPQEMRDFERLLGF